MDNKYGDIMDKVRVTNEMRQRIITNIGSYHFKERKSLFGIVGGYRYVAIAACLVLVIFASVAIPRLLAQNQEVTDTGGSPVSTCHTIDELSESVGFTVKDVAYVPFKVSKSTYSNNDGIAKITYESAKKESVVFRMSKGNEDNSGDYSDYKSEVKVNIGGNKITLKGSGKSYLLAVWSDEKYSYSIALTRGENITEWHKMIASIH